MEETCWGLLVRKLSVWADLVSLHSQSIQGPDWTLRQASSGPDVSHPWRSLVVVSSA